MIWANCESQRLKATPKAKATCPLCSGDVVAKCGKIVTHHWAHKSADCDPWYEPESDWHFNWKNRFPKEYQEVTVGNHRADVKTPKLVVEFQRSSISTDEIQERESHYKNMVWVLCGYDFWDRVQLLHIKKDDAAWQILKKEFEKVDYRMGKISKVIADNYYNSCVEISFVWNHPRKSWFYAKKPIVIDSPIGLFHVLEIKDSSIINHLQGRTRQCKVLRGEPLTSKQFLTRCGLSEDQILLCNWKQQ